MNFAKQVSAWVTKAKKVTNEEFGRNTLLLYSDIVTGTPVDTGTLQNNWQFSATSLTNNHQYGARKGATAALARASKKAAEAKVETPVIIFNNMEYAEAIERGLGKGQRMPARMVAQAIAMAQARAGK